MIKRHFFYFYWDPFKFPEKFWGFRFGLINEFTEIVLCAFGLFTGYHLGLFASINIIF